MHLFHLADLGGTQVVNRLEARVDSGLRFWLIGRSYMFASVKNRLLVLDEGYANWVHAD